MADDKRASEQGRQVSGVVPVLFSADAEAHDDAFIAGESDTAWRSPFSGGPELRPASGQ